MNESDLNVRNVAHGLNNQIMILMNALDRLMILCPQEADAREAVAAAERCASLTRQLLPAMKHHSMTPCWVREIVSETARAVRPLLPVQNRVDVSCRVDCRITACAASIQQALVSLCLHAVDAMAGPGVISLGAETEGDFVVLWVRDTGPGLPSELCESFFEPRLSRNGRLGALPPLDRVRELVEESGGNISLEHSLPLGACFRIRFPAVREELVAIP